MLAADAKKAGNASEDTRLTPRPPFLTGKLACSHCVSDRSELVIPWTGIIIKSIYMYKAQDRLRATNGRTVYRRVYHLGM